jgi:hypothetical protein
MPTNKKRVQAYVNDATYLMLDDYASERKISVSEAVSELLQTANIPVYSPAENSTDYVTRSEFEQKIQALISHMENHFTRELARAETCWESAASHSAAVHNQIIKGLVDAHDSQARSLPSSPGSTVDT